MSSPRGDLPVAGVGADDGVDVAVENGQSPSVPLDHEPLVRVSRRPEVLRGGPWPKAGLNIGESRSIGRQPGLAQCRRIGDRVNLEVVDVAIELEPHHPVDQIAGRHLCCRSDRGMELEQATAGTTDDPTGVVGPGDDLDRAGERLVRDGIHLSPIRRRDRRLQVVDGFMHLPTVRARRAPPGKVRSSPDQREDGVGGRVTVQILCQSLTDTSPPIPDGSHTDSLARAVHRLGDVVPKGDRSSGRVIREQEWSFLGVQCRRAPTLTPRRTRCLQDPA